MMRQQAVYAENYPKQQLSEFQYILKEPSSCSDDEIAGFYTLLVESSNVAVKPSTIELIYGARLLGFAYSDDRLVAIRAVKNQQEEYRKKVLKLPELLERYKLELGYAYVVPSHRRFGIYSELTRLILSSITEPMYSSVISEVAANLLRKYGFYKIDDQLSTSGLPMQIMLRD